MLKPARFVTVKDLATEAKVSPPRRYPMVVISISPARWGTSTLFRPMGSFRLQRRTNWERLAWPRLRSRMGSCSIARESIWWRSASEANFDAERGATHWLALTSPPQSRDVWPPPLAGVAYERGSNPGTI